MSYQVSDTEGLQPRVHGVHNLLLSEFDRVVLGSYRFPQLFSSPPSAEEDVQQANNGDVLFPQPNAQVVDHHELDLLSGHGTERTELAMETAMQQQKQAITDHFQELVDCLLEEKRSLADEVCRLRQENETLSYAASLREETEALRAQLRALQEDRARILKTRLQQETSLNESRIQMYELTQEIRELKEKKAQWEQMSIKQDQQVTALIRQNYELTENMEQRERTRKLDEQQLGWLKSQLSQLKNQLDRERSATAVKADLEAQVMNLTAEVNHLTQVKNKEQEKIAEMIGKVHEAKDAEIAKADAATHELRVQLTWIKEEKEDLAMQNADLTRKLEEQKTQHEVELSILRAGECDSQKKIAELTKRLRKMEQEKREMEKRAGTVQSIRERDYSPSQLDAEREHLEADSGLPISEDLSKK